MIDKHYENEGFSYYRNRYVNSVITVKVSDEEKKMLKELYPGKSTSFAIRSLIHKAYEQETYKR